MLCSAMTPLEPQPVGFIYIEHYMNHQHRYKYLVCDTNSHSSENGEDPNSDTTMTRYRHKYRDTTNNFEK
jgi:hypothetical protein